MDRDFLQRQFDLAEAHVALGALTLAEQRALVTQLRFEGREAIEAVRLLKHIELIQGLQIGHRDRLTQELGAGTTGSKSSGGPPSGMPE